MNLHYFFCSQKYTGHTTLKIDEMHFFYLFFIKLYVTICFSIKYKYTTFSFQLCIKTFRR
jgi:hypothetical protein